MYTLQVMAHASSIKFIEANDIEIETTYWKDIDHYEKYWSKHKKDRGVDNQLNLFDSQEFFSHLRTDSVKLGKWVNLIYFTDSKDERILWLTEDSATIIIKNSDGNIIYKF